MQTHKLWQVQNTDTIGVVVTDVTMDPFFAILVKSVDKVAGASKTILIGIGYHHAEKSVKPLIPLLRKRCSCQVGRSFQSPF